jgi:hypothetical protein
VGAGSQEEGVGVVAAAAAGETGIGLYTDLLKVCDST